MERHEEIVPHRDPKSKREQGRGGRGGRGSSVRSIDAGMSTAWRDSNVEGVESSESILPNKGSNKPRTCADTV